MILRRREDRFSEVVREWEGGTVVVIGGGLSLTLEQVELVRAARVRCIAVNDAYLWADFADVLYAADSQWWDWQARGLPKPLLGLTGGEVRARYLTFAGQRCSIEYAGNNITDAAVHILRNKKTNYQELSLDPCYLATAQGKNSGFQAINLAVLAGAKRVILLGIDGRPGHFHGGHPRPTPEHFYEAMRKAFSAAEKAILDAGVSVVNCSPGSAVDSFPKQALEAALA